MIRLADIWYRYPSAEWALKEISLETPQGQYLVICGGNGSGKSTLGYLLNGLAPHFFGGVLQGSVYIDNASIDKQTPGDLLTTVGLVFQNADAQLFNATVEDEIAFGLESLGLPPDQIERRIQDISRALDIEDLLHRSPMELSGGEKRLVAVASVLCLNPKVLVLDEPFANLDGRGTGLLRKILQRIHQQGRNLVVIEQIIGPFLEDADRCIVIEEGRIVSDGPARNARSVLSEKHLIPCYPRRDPAPPPRTDLVLSVRNICCRIQDRPLLENISFELRQGEAVSLIGRNGAGKTTLIKHLNGLFRPVSGEVLFRGENIASKPPEQMAARVGMSFQNANNQFFKSTVKEELAAGPRMLGKNHDEWIREICDLFALNAFLEKSPHRLSEGEKKRTAIASILAMKPELLILDEPAAGQDGRFRETLAAVLNILENRGSTILIVTHDLTFAGAVTDRWILLENGAIRADGPSHIIQSHPALCASAIDGHVS